MASRTYLFATAVLLLLAFPFFGAETLPFSETFRSGTVAHRIFFELRLPRLLLTLCAGGGLALLGGAYQTLFHNPLAEPYVLGVSSAVTLGAALAEIFLRVPADSLAGTATAFTAALLATALLIGVGASRAGQAVDRIVLFGMGLNFVLSSLLFLALSYHYQHLGGGSMRWLFGQIPWVSPRQALTFAAVSSGFIALLLVFARHLDALSLGDGVALTLGFSPARSRLLLMGVSSLFLSFIVSFTGGIGFIGLVVPHIIRLTVRPHNTRTLFAFSLLGGALFLALSDIASRALLPPFEFPIGVITTILGGPVFLWLLWKR